MKPPLRRASHAAASAHVPFGIRTFFSLRKSARRWPVACRAAISIGLLVAVGWITGHTSAGLTATIGAFTSLYVSDRPYRNRAQVLAGIALSFAVVVSLGIAVQRLPFMAVPLLVVIAMIATFVCQAIRIGPPGAYMFVLACAAGTSMPAAHRAFYDVGLLVLAGGAVSWCVHMAGALVSPRGPERTAVIGAARAVAHFAAHCAAHFAESAGDDVKDQARHDAASSLHEAWATLVSYQSPHSRVDAALSHLLALNRELHLLFAACVNAADSRAGSQAVLAERARKIGEQAASSGERSTWAHVSHVPLGRLRSSALLREALRRGSPAWIVAARVGVAVAVAGAIGAVPGVERAYWAMAAAVLVLHQGLDWERTWRRGVERTSGTLVGLCVASAIFAIHPAGPWLVLTMMSLQFLVEMLVTRNYALAVVFVTSLALLIASGGQRVLEPGALLWARGLDTALGCGVGLLVYAGFKPRGSSLSIRQRIVLTLAEARAVLEHLASGSVTTPAALRTRRDLQHAIVALVESYEVEAGGLGRHRVIAGRMRPMVDATQRLGYKVLAVCWAVEATAEERLIVSARANASPDELISVDAALEEIIAALRDGGACAATHQRIPDFLRGEIAELRESLAHGSLHDDANARDGRRKQRSAASL